MFQFDSFFPLILAIKYYYKKILMNKNAHLTQHTQRHTYSD